MLVKKPQPFCHPYLPEYSFIPAPPSFIVSHQNLPIIFSFKHMDREVLNLWACHKDWRPICLRTEINIYNAPHKTSYSSKIVSQVRISFGNSHLLYKLLYAYCLYSKYKRLLWLIVSVLLISILNYMYFLSLSAEKWLVLNWHLWSAKFLTRWSSSKLKM